VDLIDLDLVTAVAETGSITHGAARARLSLPSASGRIRHLEHTLGVTLFDRGRRGVALTPAGQVLLRHARSVCHAVGQLRTELDEYAQGHGATVRVQANTAATASLLPAAAVSFLARYPHARIDLEERPSHRIIAAVAERRADLGIVADSAELGQLETRVVRPDPLVVVTLPDDPLAEPWADRQLVACFTSDRDLSDTARALRDHLLAHADDKDDTDEPPSGGERE
jgi:DNA-binding transcriptional LysR family regulator